MKLPGHIRIQLIRKGMSFADWCSKQEPPLDYFTARSVAIGVLTGLISAEARRAKELIDRDFKEVDVNERA